MQDKEKTGVFTGSYAINPLNGVRSYLSGFLTMFLQTTVQVQSCVFLPMMTRDFEFAKKFDIPIIQVIAKDGTESELDRSLHRY